MTIHSISVGRREEPDDPEYLLPHGLLVAGTMCGHGRYEATKALGQAASCRDIALVTIVEVLAAKDETNAFAMDQLPTREAQIGSNPRLTRIVEMLRRNSQVRTNNENVPRYVAHRRMLPVEVSAPTVRRLAGET